MNATIGILLLLGSYAILAFIAFDIGEYRGRKRSRDEGRVAFLKTLEQLTEAQRNAGVTPEQMVKINESLSGTLVKTILSDLSKKSV